MSTPDDPPPPPPPLGFSGPSIADPTTLLTSSNTSAGPGAGGIRKRRKSSKGPPPSSPSPSLAVVDGSQFKRRPDPSAEKVTPPCSECGRRFWSWKALFGHMRCHPERQWRGINPPANAHRQRAVDRTQFSEVEHEVAGYLILLANGPPRVHGRKKDSVGFHWKGRARDQHRLSSSAAGGERVELDLNMLPGESNDGCSSAVPSLDLKLGI